MLLYSNLNANSFWVWLLYIWLIFEGHTIGAEWKNEDIKPEDF